MNIIIWSTLSIFVFIISNKLIKLFKKNFLNPVLITIFSMILILIFSKTSYSTYSVSTKWITYLLGPIVVMLGIPLYKSRITLKENFIPILAGIISSILVSIFSVKILSTMLGLNKEIINSMVAKSITTPMAIEVTDMIGGLSGLTVVFVIITGIVGASISSLVFNLFKIKNPIAQGIGLGSSAHGIGTSKAVEISPEVGAASGLAMGVTGLITVLIFSVFSNLF